MRRLHVRLPRLLAVCALFVMCGAYPPPKGGEVTLDGGRGSWHYRTGGGCNNEPVYEYQVQDVAAHARAGYRSEHLSGTLEGTWIAAKPVAVELIAGDSSKGQPTDLDRWMRTGTLAFRVGYQGQWAGFEAGPILRFQGDQLANQTPIFVSAEVWAGNPSILYGWGQFLAGPYAPLAAGLGHASEYARVGVGVAISPGYTETQFLMRASARLGDNPTWLDADVRSGGGTWTAIVGLTFAFDESTETVAEPASATTTRGPVAVARIGPLWVSRRASLSGVEIDSQEMQGDLVAAELQAEAYPLALLDNGPLADLGVYVEGFRSEVEVAGEDPLTSAHVSQTSTVSEIAGGAAYRYHVADSPLTEVTLRAGYRRFAFPVAAGPFPGARYGGAELGVRLAVAATAVGILDQIGVVLGAAYAPSLELSGEAAKLGDRVWAEGVELDGGVRARWSWLEVSLIARYSHRDADNRGTSTLRDSPGQLVDGSLTDTLLGGALLVGAQL